MVSKKRGIVRKSVVSCSVDHMLPKIFSLHLFLLCSSLMYCSARETITFNNSIIDRTRETLVSAGKRFELGFFTPNENSSHARYVGIWYYRSEPQIVVWVANRDNPLFDTSGVFTIKDGNLQVLDGKEKPYWSTGLKSSSFEKKRVNLMDSGNLVLSDDLSNKILWESFHNPTDTFLSGMNMDKNLKLTSWKSHDDPGTGNFTFGIDGESGSFTIRKNLIRPYWNGESGNLVSSDQMPPAIAYFLSNFSKRPDPKVRIGSKNSTIPILSSSGSNNTRLVMNHTGELQYLLCENKNVWSLLWMEPSDRCSVLKSCGKFGSCNRNNGLLCKCLPGFKPSNSDNWNPGDFSVGCSRRSPICSKNGDAFLSLKMMNVRKWDTQVAATNDTDCRNKCHADCECQAYSYEAQSNTGRGASTNTAMCNIWTDDLSDLQEEYADGGRNLSVRVAVSDIASTVRNCDTCGTNMIPYPLSTEPKCGDPMYFSFQCNKSTGQVFFNALNGTYRVTNINPSTTKFVIQAKDAGNCGARNSTSKALQLNQSLPFHVNNLCNASDLGIVKDEVEISWDPPLEPICNSSTDCKD